MRVLVISEEYPNNNGGVALMYVHTRNLYYKQHGIEIDELNFSAKKSYVFQGINVIALDEFEERQKKYDLLILHAANIKHHYVFLKKYGSLFKKFLFFYHGHEVLRINKVYSKSYTFIKSHKSKEIIHDIYDLIKLHLWRNYLPKIIDKSYFVFVSNWMYEEFLKWVKIPKGIIKDHYSITYNCVGKEFEQAQYNQDSEKLYDFITIRSNLDNSKYGVDIVNQLAFNTPNARFLLVGKGDYFSYNKKAPNIEWRNQTMQHEEIIDVLDKSKYALMPTRTDAQGLMMCEMAAYGIPVITSNIPVCHEVFDGFRNAFFIDNDNKNESLDEYLLKNIKSIKHTKYYENNTVYKELIIIKQLIEDSV